MADHPEMRAYRGTELNALLTTLQQTVAAHHPTIGMLLAMALLLDLIHEHFALGAADDWMADVVPILNREVLRGTVAALSGASVCAVDQSFEDRVQ